MKKNDLYRKIEDYLKDELNDNRVRHTRGVADTAACLSMRYGADMDKAYLAGLLHDCAKGIPDRERIKKCEKWGIEVTMPEYANPSLLHAKMGAYIARNEFDVTDPSVLSAIRYHTTGRAGMTLPEKIIYVADYIEPLRDKAPGLPEIRRLAFEDIDRAIAVIAQSTLQYLLQQGIEPDEATLEVFRYYSKITEETGNPQT